MSKNHPASTKALKRRSLRHQEDLAGQLTRCPAFATL
jgi:hypothetical protein